MQNERSDALIEKPTFSELEGRIQEVARFHGGTLPIEHALVWEGYIGALAEWGLISIGDHERLLRLLGKTSAGPSLCIFLGARGARDVTKREGIDKRPIRRKSQAKLPKARNQR